MSLTHTHNHLHSNGDVHDHEHTHENPEESGNVTVTLMTAPTSEDIEKNNIAVSAVGDIAMLGSITNNHDDHTHIIELFPIDSGLVDFSASVNTDLQSAGSVVREDGYFVHVTINGMFGSEAIFKLVDANGKTHDASVRIDNETTVETVLSFQAEEDSVPPYSLQITYDDMTPQPEPQPLAFRTANAEMTLEEEPVDEEPTDEEPADDDNKYKTVTIILGVVLGLVVVGIVTGSIMINRNRDARKADSDN